MIQLYQITNHIVDLTRNQITRDQHMAEEVVQNIPPKTLMVLTELAKNQGQVVSHDHLMNVVWQDTVVSPNSLQRCITQLRKALADNGKEQAIIKTHAKQGYSLDALVTILSDGNQLKKVTSDDTLRTGNHLIVESPSLLESWSLKLTISLCLLLMVSGYFYSKKTTRDFTFTTLTPITASDNLERNASFSSDGKFVIYHRYDGLCDNNLWAKELSTGKERRLTKTYGFYSDHSFTPDGKKLAFMAKVSCQDNKRQKNCWNLMTLDFYESLTEPRKPELVVSCDSGALSDPIWLDNGNIVALNKQEQSWQIVKFMPNAPEFVSFYTDKAKSYYQLLHSHKDNALIALAVDASNQHVIDLIDQHGQLISSHAIKRPKGLSSFVPLKPIVDSIENRLIVSTGKRIYSLSFTGEMAQISTLSHNNLSTIKMNKKGSEIVTVQGIYDKDIALVRKEELMSSSPSLEPSLDFNQVHQPYPSIARSIAEDTDAKFQPNGNLIAFISNRSGIQQLWLEKEGQQIQLTHFSLDTVIAGFSWSPAGTSLMVVANNELFQVALDKTIKKTPLNIAALAIFQWQDNDELLMIVSQKGQPQLSTYNFQTNTLNTVISRHVKWAHKIGDEQLYYLDRANTLWSKTPSNTTPLNALNGQFGSNRFSVDKGVIYSVNNKKEFWSYRPGSTHFEIIGTMDSYAHYVSDVRHSKILITQSISAKKEVVILSNTTML